MNHLNYKSRRVSNVVAQTIRLKQNTMYKAIKEAKKGATSKIRVAECFNITSGTLACWLKDKNEIINSFEGGLFKKQKRMRNWCMLENFLRRAVAFLVT